MMTELLGYAASIFIATSLFMSNIKWLRYVNAIGCILFVIYGVIIGAYPVAFMNGLCVFINIYQLIKLSKKQRVGQSN